MDHVVCAFCGHKARSLVRHIETALPPHPTLTEYREKYPTLPLVCAAVDQRRRTTNKIFHGTETYRNSLLQSEGIRRAFKEDPSILARVRETKKARYGVSGYVNMEKRRETLLLRYGVDNAMKNPEVARKSVQSRKALYGDNPVERTSVIEKAVLEHMHVSEGKTLREIGKILGVTEAVVSYWMRKHGVQVVRKIVSPKVKEYIEPVDTVKAFLEYCYGVGHSVSFLEYGREVGEYKAQRLKRLFNAGRIYAHLRDELFKISRSPDLCAPFLAKITQPSGAVQGRSR